MFPSIRDITPLRAALAVFLVASATIVGARIFQHIGYAPCELCLKERWPYYAGVPLAALVILAARSGPTMLARWGLVLLALIFAASAVLGTYHAGVEWHFWPGPSECTGPLDTTGFAAFQEQLRVGRVVRCDAAAIRIFGLSLAGWNAVISAAIAAVALVGATQVGVKK